MCLALSLLVSCGGGSEGKGPTVPVTDPIVPPPPPVNPIISKFVAPLRATMGGQFTVELDTRNALKCALSWSSDTLTVGVWTIRPDTPGNLRLIATCNGKVGTTPTTQEATVTVAFPAPTMTLSSDKESVVQGGAVVLSWTSTNTSSCSADWTTISSVEGEQRVNMSQSKTFSMSCLGLDGSGVSSTTTVSVAVPVTLQVFDPQPASGGISNLRFYVHGLSVDSVNIGSDGKASLIPTRALPDSFDIVIDAQNVSSRLYHPTVARVSRNDALAGLRVVLVPRSWSVEKGIFANQKVSIDLGLAYKPSASGNSSFYPRLFSTDGRAVWQYDIFSLPFENMPIPAVLDRRLSNAPLTAVDSVAIWDRLNEQERRFGRDMFFPANALSVDTLNALRVVLFDNPNATFSGSAGFTVSNYGIIGGGNIFAYSRMYSGIMYGITSHEVTHVLGFGHTCSWRTVMVSGCPGTPNPGSFEASFEATTGDVAYIELFYRVVEIQRKENASIAMTHAHQGYQQRMLGMPKEKFLIRGFVPGRAGGSISAIHTHIH